MTMLTFAELRAANIARLPTFRNALGEPAHSEPDGSDWKLSAWVNATAGELGELGELILMVSMSSALGRAGNVVKKFERGDITLDEARPVIAKEIADVQVYLDLLAFRCGIDLSAATVLKFNEVSERVGSPIRLFSGRGR